MLALVPRTVLFSLWYYAEDISGFNLVVAAAELAFVFRFSRLSAVEVLQAAVAVWFVARWYSDLAYRAFASSASRPTCAIRVSLLPWLSLPVPFHLQCAAGRGLCDVSFVAAVAASGVARDAGEG